MQAERKIQKILIIMICLGALGLTVAGEPSPLLNEEEFLGPVVKEIVDSAREYSRAGKHNQALAEYDKIIQNYPDKPLITFYIVEVKASIYSKRMKNYDQALAEYDKVMQKYPDNVVVDACANSGKANVYWNKKDYEKAIRTSRETLAKYKNDETPLFTSPPLPLGFHLEVTVRTDIGDMYAEQGKYEPAILEYQKAIDRLKKETLPPEVKSMFEGTMKAFSEQIEEWRGRISNELKRQRR